MTMTLLKDKETEKSGPHRKGETRDAWLWSRGLGIKKKGFQYPHERRYTDYKANREVEIMSAVNSVMRSI
ncbi:MAG TPA: hypothetical protein DCP92_03125, partial [Nitrospiraceae bacterium]|nr:hypothetical protein [Nitrospiraceae bacterium]